ncbi:hypothetical protein BDFB_015229 [Asbolus verrucosus]|uniref:Uncharacterized protein n=1 Tax=Asbolus verrucosus TaxID=1661398 RepID=A0A482W3U8_ASBVE|nr:hypothetical protein BDFB_015229 [Asbolus verrucosus]
MSFCYARTVKARKKVFFKSPRCLRIKWGSTF